MVEFLQVVARRRGKAQLVADEIVEHGAGVAADGTVRFVGDNQVEIGWRKKLLIFVVEEERLNRADDDFRPPPIVAVLFVDDRLVIGCEQRSESLLGLIFQFQPIHKEQDAPGVARAQE